MRRALPSTVRMRLTFLYSGLFLVSSIGLLTLTYLLVARESVYYFISGTPGQISHARDAYWRGASGGAAAPTVGHAPTVDQLQAQVQQLHSLVARQSAAELHQLLVQSGIALAVMLVVSIGLGWIVAGRVLFRLRTITTATRDLSASKLHERLALDGPDDELKELANTFDDLLARLEASFEAQRQFVANASHELRTPLARARTLLEVALADPRATTGSLRATCERVLAAGERQESLIEALLMLARGERGLDRREAVDLTAVTDEVLLVRRPELERRGLRVDVNLAAAQTVGDAHLVERLVVNLVDNAMRHNIVDGRVGVSTGTRSGRAILRVTNTGPVVPASELDRIVQPFQRLGGRRVGQGDGLGLGLSIVRAVAAAHHAILNIQSGPEGGLDVSVSFPLPDSASGPSILQARASVRRGRAATADNEAAVPPSISAV
jgi:signal transduction histidine kinase